MRIPSARLKASSLSPRCHVRLASSSSSSSSSNGLLPISSSSPHSRGRSYSQLDGSSQTSSEPDERWWTLARSPPSSSSSSSSSRPTFFDYPLSKPAPSPALRYQPRIRPTNGQASIAEMNNPKISLLPRLFPAGVPAALPAPLAAISLLPQPIPRLDAQGYGYAPAPRFLLSHKPSSLRGRSSAPPPRLATIIKSRPSSPESSDLPPPTASPLLPSSSSRTKTRRRNLPPHLFDALATPSPPKRAPPILLTPPPPPSLPSEQHELYRSMPPPPSFLELRLARHAGRMDKMRKARVVSLSSTPRPPTLPAFLTIPSVVDRLLGASEGKKEERKSRRNIKKKERKNVAARVERKSTSNKQQVSKLPTFLLQAIKLEAERKEKKLALKRESVVAGAEASGVVGGVGKGMGRQQRSQVALGSTLEVLTEESKVVLREEEDVASTFTSPLLAETLRAIAPLLDQHLDVLNTIKLELQTQRRRGPSPSSTTSELGSSPSQNSSLLAQFSGFGGEKKKSPDEEEVRRIMWKQAQEVGELRKALRQLQEQEVQRDSAVSTSSELGSTWNARRFRRPEVDSETISSIHSASVDQDVFDSYDESGSIEESPFATAPFESSSEPTPFQPPPSELYRPAVNLKSLFKLARSSSDFEVALKVLASNDHDSHQRDESDFGAFVDASIRLSLVPRAMEFLADPSSGAKAWIEMNPETLQFKLRRMIIALVPESSPSSESDEDASSSTPSLPYTASDLNAFNQHTATLLPAPDVLILAISLRAYYLLGPSGNEGLQAISSLILAYQDTFTKPTSRSKNRLEQGRRVTRDLDSIRPFIDPEVMAAFDETQAPSPSFHRGRLLGIVERVARETPIGQAIRDLDLPASATGGIPPNLPPFPKLIEAYLRPSLLAHPDDWFITLISLYLRRHVGGPSSEVFLEAVEKLGVGGEADRWTRGSGSELNEVAKIALREIGGDLKDVWGVEKTSLWDVVLGEGELGRVSREKERQRELERDRAALGGEAFGIRLKREGSGEMTVKKRVLGFFER